MNAIRHVPAFVLLAVAVFPSASLAQRQPGHPIGKVTTIGNLVALELDSGAIPPAHLFDLDRRTLRFTPSGDGYRVESVPLDWDSNFGPELHGAAVTLHGFAFPFSGRSWDTLNVAIGAITFGTMRTRPGRRLGGPPVGNRTGAGFSRRDGFAMQRYPLLRTVGRTFINTIPGIAAFVKPDMRGQRYEKELPDRAVVTWTLTEPYGTIQSFTWAPTVNRIQAVLHKDGEIDLSYDSVSARDAVVGVFPMVEGTVTRTLATLPDPVDAGVAPNLDVKSLTLASIGGLFLKATIETRGPVLPDGDPAIDGITYRIGLDAHRPASRDISDATVVWTLRGIAGRRFGRGRGMAPRYVAFGSGVEPSVTVEGNTISVRGILPRALSGVKRIFVSADAAAGDPSMVADRVDARAVALTGLRSPEVDLSSMTAQDGAFPVVYEGFHWPGIPPARDVACSVIKALGDHFDFIASYSDFRVDNPEGGTPSTGPRGGHVTGIGARPGDPEEYCSQGELQWMYVEPVSTSAVQFDQRSPNGSMTDYNYAMSQIGHELVHRWAAYANAVVNGDTIPLGPVHWAAGLNLPAAFPYSRSYEADAMGASTWKANGDGTWTQLDRDYYSPAKGYSWLDLYLMGLARPGEVKPFFILRNLRRTGRRDADGHPIYTGDKTVVTIQDVIAAMGPREPDYDHSQKKFNTAIVVMTLPGKRPTRKLIEGANAIAKHWLEFWHRTTGGRSVMTVSPK